MHLFFASRLLHNHSPRINLLLTGTYYLKMAHSTAQCLDLILATGMAVYVEHLNPTACKYILLTKSQTNLSFRS